MTSHFLQGCVETSKFSCHSGDPVGLAVMDVPLTVQTRAILYVFIDFIIMLTV